MGIYVNAYRILDEACIKYCESQGETYDDIIAEVYTDVLGLDYIYCRCVDTHFEYLIDWYEGGNFTILNMKYAGYIFRKGFRDE